MRNFCIAAATILFAGGTAALAQSSSPNGVKTLAPEGAIKTTGTWDVGTRAGDFVFVAPRPTRWSRAMRLAFGRRF